MSHTEGDLPMSHAHVLANAVKLCVAGTLLLLSAVASAQPFNSFLLDTSRVIARDPANPERTAVAFTDSLGLVVWTDATTGSLGACRVLPDLRPLDSVFVRLNGLGEDAGDAPAAAAVGRRWVVVWLKDGRDGLPVRLAVVEPDGVPSRVITVDSSHANRNSPCVAASGDNALVVWEPGDRVVCRRYATDGTAVDTAPVRLSALPGLQSRPDVATGASGNLVVWQQTGPSDTAVFCNLVGFDGVAADSCGRLVARAAGVTRPRVAYGGGHYVVSWQDDADSLRVARIDEAGTVIDSTGVAFAYEVADLRPALGCAGETTLIAWEHETYQPAESAYVLAVRFDGRLQLLDPEPIAVSGATAHNRLGPGGVSVATSLEGLEYAVVWCQSVDAVWSEEVDVVGRRVAVTGRVMDSVPAALSLAANSQTDMDVASDGWRFLAVWLDERVEQGAFHRSVRGRLFTQTGQVVGESSFVVARGPAARDVRICYGCYCYLVVWLDLDNGDHVIKCARVTGAGVVLDTVPIEVVRDPDGGRLFSAAFGGRSFIVVFADERRIVGTRVTEGGELLDSLPFLLQREAWKDYTYAGLCYAGDSLGFFLSPRFWYVSSVMGYVELSLCDTLGRILDSSDVLVRETRAYVQPYLPCAYGPGVFLAGMWSKADDYHAWRVSPDNRVLDTLEARCFFVNPAVVFDGLHFLVVGSDWEWSNKVIGVRIAPDGTLLDSVPLSLAEFSTDSVEYGYDRKNVAAATNRDGMTALVFSSYELGVANTKRLRALVLPRLVGGLVQDDVLSTRLAPPPLTSVARVGSALSLRLADRAQRQLFIFDATGRCSTPAGLTAVRAVNGVVTLDLSELRPGVHFITDGSRHLRHRLVLVR